MVSIKIFFSVLDTLEPFGSAVLRRCNPHEAHAIPRSSLPFRVQVKHSDKDDHGVYGSTREGSWT